MVNDLLQAIVSFDAGLAPVYCSLPARGDGDNFVFEDPQLQAAPYATVGADCDCGALGPDPFLRAGKESTGGAGVNTGSAELAVCILQGFGAYPVVAVEIGIGGEKPKAAHLVTHSHAPAAHDAEIVVAIEERLSQHGQIPECDIISYALQADIEHRLLQLAHSILGAVLASHGHRKPPHALPQIPAFVLSLAEEAAGRMVGQSQNHLQGMPPHLLQLIGPGLHHHALPGRCVAGCGIGVHALHRDDTKLAGAYWLEVRMVAESRDI